MTDTWFVAFGLLGLVALANAVLTVALMRQIGVLHERLRPTGAGELDGPVRGDRLPRLEFSHVNIAKSGRDPFASPIVVLAYVQAGCGLCDDVMPIIRSYARSTPEGVELIAATDAEPGEATAFGARNGINFTYVRDRELSARYRLPGSPYFLVLQPDEHDLLVLGAATVTTLEQLEDLVDGALAPDEEDDPDPDDRLSEPELEGLLVVAGGSANGGGQH